MYVAENLGIDLWPPSGGQPWNLPRAEEGKDIAEKLGINLGPPSRSQAYMVQSVSSHCEFFSR